MMDTDKPKQKRNVITTPLAVLLGVVVLQILRVFLPWQLVTLITSLVIVFSVYKWATIKTGLSPFLAKFIALIVISIFLGNLLLTWVEQKYPWVPKALSARELWYSFIATDKFDPKYPEKLAMDLYETKRLKIEKKQEKYIKTLKSLKAKIVNDEDTEEDEKMLKTVEEKLAEIEKEMANITLGPKNPLVAKSPKKEEKSPLVYNFTIPSGDGRNVKENMISTGIFVEVNDQIFFTIKKGGPALARKGKGKKDFIKISSSFSATVQNKREVQFIKYRPTEVEVKIIKRKPTDSSQTPLKASTNNVVEKTVSLVKPAAKKLGFLGRDFSSLTFTENAYVFRDRNWRIQLVSAEVLADGNLKLNFIHTTIRDASKHLEKPELIWIKEPEENVYLTDSFGKRYQFVREEKLGTHASEKDGKTFLGGEELPLQVPVAYSLIFSKLNENVKEINFVSHYFWCNSYHTMFNSCFGNKHTNIIIRGIKLFKEITESEVQVKTEMDKPSSVKETTSSLQ